MPRAVLGGGPILLRLTPAPAPKAAGVGVGASRFRSIVLLGAVRAVGAGVARTVRAGCNARDCVAAVEGGPSPCRARCSSQPYPVALVDNKDSGTVMCILATSG